MRFNKESYTKKVRKRKSYFFWDRIINSLDRSNFKDGKIFLDATRKTCNIVFQEIDNRNMFNSEQQANWDEESMEVALFDFALTSSLSNQTKKFEKSSKSA